MKRPTDALAEHRDELIALLKDCGVKSGVIFGSTATCTDIERSDLVGAVRFDHRPRGFAFYGTLARVEEKTTRITGVRVDVVDFRVLEGHDRSAAVMVFL